MSRRSLVGWTCAAVYLGVFGRDRSDADLSALRADYMATWKPTHLDSEMLFEHPSNGGPMWVGSSASLERKLGFLTPDSASAARMEAFAAADENGWSRGDPQFPMDAPRLKRMLGGAWATLRVSPMATAPSQVLLRMKIE